MALLAYQLSTIAGSPIIWGEKDNLEFFLSGLTPVGGTSRVDKSIAFKGSTVHRYPGDPNPYARKGGSRRLILDNSTGGIGTPGKRFWLEYTNKDDESLNEVRQFTCVGNMGLLRSQCKAAVTKDCVFRMSSGKAFDLLVALKADYAQFLEG